MKPLTLVGLVVDRRMLLGVIRIVGEVEVEVEDTEVVNRRADQLFQQIRLGLGVGTIIMLLIAAAADMITDLLVCHLDHALVDKGWVYQVGHVRRDSRGVDQSMASGLEAF
jgi:hypothetical protein